MLIFFFIYQPVNLLTRQLVNSLPKMTIITARPNPDHYKDYKLALILNKNHGKDPACN